MSDESGSPPVKGSTGSAGYDVTSAQQVTISPRDRASIPTGFKLMECPTNTYLRLAPRSGLAMKGIDVAAGVVDSDYRGHLKVILVNNTDTEFVVHVGDRIAQIIPEIISAIPLRCVDTAGACVSRVDALVTKRGQGGFGSTGFSTVNQTQTTGDSALPTCPSDSAVVMDDKIRNAWLC